VQITTILNAHDYPDVTKDTLESIHHYMTDDVMIMVDGASWDKMSKINFDAHLLEGFWHNSSRGPYRNIILGLWEASKKWPDTEWFCCMEYDCLVASDAFKDDLKLADQHGCCGLGTNHKIHMMQLPFLEIILGDKLKTHPNYLLGCCTFYNGVFIKSLHGFFEKFLYYTNEFQHGFFPDFKGYCFAEYLMPTLAAHYGVVRSFSSHSTKSGWGPGHKRYPIRFRPDLSEEEVYPESTILHPVKKYNDPIREYHRKKRERAG
jgi:hypothetical protein